MSWECWDFGDRSNLVWRPACGWYTIVVSEAWVQIQLKCARNASPDRICNSDGQLSSTGALRFASPVLCLVVPAAGDTTNHTWVTKQLAFVMTSYLGSVRQASHVNRRNHYPVCCSKNKLSIVVPLSPCNYTSVTRQPALFTLTATPILLTCISTEKRSRNYFSHEHGPFHNRYRYYMIALLPCSSLPRLISRTEPRRRAISMTSPVPAILSSPICRRADWWSCSVRGGDLDVE